MNLTKNQIYIISAIVILVVAWFLFFRKKPNAKVAQKMATPPAPPATETGDGESGWAGDKWGGAYTFSPEQTMKMLDGSGNAAAYNIYPESGFATGNVNAPSNTGVPGVAPSLNFGNMLGYGNFLSNKTPWLSGANA